MFMNKFPFIQGLVESVNRYRSAEMAFKENVFLEHVKREAHNHNEFVVNKKPQTSATQCDTLSVSFATAQHIQPFYGFNWPINCATETTFV